MKDEPILKQGEVKGRSVSQVPETAEPCHLFHPELDQIHRPQLELPNSLANHENCMPSPRALQPPKATTPGSQRQLGPSHTTVIVGEAGPPK